MTTNPPELQDRGTRPRVAVVRGGYSGESVISHQSAARMMASLVDTWVDPLYVTITQHAWTCEDPAGNPLPFDRGTFTAGHDETPFVAALIAIHGSPGEDGLLQGYLDMLGIPYQTGDVLNMALTFSKHATTAMLRQLGFPVAASVLLRTHEVDPHQLAEVPGYPCFVKPDRSGSSLGVSKVSGPDQLGPALVRAFAECTSVLVEGAITGRELTCGVLQWDNAVRALPVCEVRTSREFFDYEAKYHAKDTQEIIPAPIPGTITQLVQERSKAIYTALGCRGLVRVDHFWTGTDLITIEVNTVPGFSPASIFPQMIQAQGMDVDAVVRGIVEELILQRSV